MPSQSFSAESAALIDPVAGEQHHRVYVFTRERRALRHRLRRGNSVRPIERQPARFEYRFERVALQALVVDPEPGLVMNQSLSIGFATLEKRYGSFGE